jgi:hypothetical protein
MILQSTLTIVNREKKWQPAVQILNIEKNYKRRNVEDSIAKKKIYCT